MRFIVTSLAALFALPMSAVFLVVDGSPLDAFRGGGITMFALVPAALVMVAAIIGAAALELKRPGPIVVYFVGPLLVLLVGASGSFYGHRQVFHALAMVDSGAVAELFAAGSAEASRPMVLGLSVVGGGLLAVFLSGLIGAVFSPDGRAWNGAWLALIGGTFGVWAYGRAGIESAQASVYAAVARADAGSQALIAAEGVSSLEFRHLVTHVLVGVAFMIGAGLVIARRKYNSGGAKVGVVVSVVVALAGTALTWVVISTEARQVNQAKEVMAHAGPLAIPVVPDDVGLTSTRRTYKLADTAYGDDAFLRVAGEATVGAVERWAKDQREVNQFGIVVAQERAAETAERTRALLSGVGVHMLPMLSHDGVPFRLPKALHGDAQHVVRTDEGYVLKGELLVDPAKVKALDSALVLHVPASLTVNDLVKELTRFDNPAITTAELPRRALPATADVESGAERVIGSLDKEVIRRVVRSKIAQVRYCYERQLMKNPRLAGKVTLKWVVSGTGKVVKASVASSSLNDLSTERCIEQKILRWRFPKPKGGGIVVVNYPFVFNPQ